MAELLDELMEFSKATLPSLKGDFPKLLTSKILSPNEVFRNLENSDETVELFGYVVEKTPIHTVKQNGKKHLLMTFILSNNCKRIRCLMYDNVIAKYEQEIRKHGVSE